MKKKLSILLVIALSVTGLSVPKATVKGKLTVTKSINLTVGKTETRLVGIKWSWDDDTRKEAEENATTSDDNDDDSDNEVNNDESDENILLRGTISFEGLDALTTLVCYENELTGLDVSHNTALTSLNCNSNEITLFSARKNIQPI